MLVASIQNSYYEEIAKSRCFSYSTSKEQELF